jgi:hypothetical protein
MFIGGGLNQKLRPMQRADRPNRRIVHVAMARKFPQSD